MIMKLQKEIRTKDKRAKEKYDIVNNGKNEHRNKIYMMIKK